MWSAQKPSYVGRFEILNEIAVGGFAVVLQAWDEELECYVAIKVLHRQYADNQEFQRRFLEEARMLRRVRSPNVVMVHDVGRLNDGRPYFVMDYADRGTLASRIRRGDSFLKPDLKSVLAIVEAVADGVLAIHEAGLVHRDIKPDNTLFQVAPRGKVSAIPADTEPPVPPTALVADNERILISDLSIAKDLVKHGASATIVGGTPQYQSPEQRDPQAKITPATDVYSASAMLWHLLTGDPPPPAESVNNRLAGVPGAWREMFAQGLALEPQARFDSMDSWRRAVEDALMQEPSDSQASLITEVGVTETTCPYKGLATFQPEDAPFFHGREALIDEIVRRLQFNRVLVVGGPSGSGKSSVVRAGLIPALIAGALPGSQDWRVVLFTPGRDPLAELYFQIAKQLPPEGFALNLEDVMNHPAMARHLADMSGSKQSLLLCIDQFEELFTLAPAAQRANFISALSAMTDPADSPVRLVITVRADFYAQCAHIPWVADMITSNQVLVGPMSKTELRRAIVEPAQSMGLGVERGLVDTIVDESGIETGSLPLVAHALVETWARREDNALTLRGFRAAGGVTGAISQTADAIFKDRFNEEERKAVERLFLRLVTPGQGAPDTRRILARSEIEYDSDPKVLQRVVENLTDARLLTVDDTSVQIAHEALLRTWPRLQAWIEASREELQTRQRISRAAAEWDAAGRDPDLLYRGTPLLSALEWASKRPDQPGEIERAFLEAAAQTKAKADANAAAKIQRKRRARRVVIAALALLAVGATMASIIASLALRKARSNETRAESATIEAREQFANALGVGAHGIVDTDPLLALVLAAEALSRAVVRPPAYDARATMLAARRVLSRDGPFIVGSGVNAGDALAVALSPDGRIIASAHRDGTIDLIDTATRKRIGPTLHGHTGGVRDVEFSSDSQLLASAGADGTLRLWSAKEGWGGAGRKIGASGDVMMGICISPDGATVATSNGDGTVQLWDVAQGKAIDGPLIDQALSLNVVAFSPDGRGLITSTHDGTIYGWAIPSREPLFPPITGAHSSHLLTMAFAPDGRHFATASTDGTSMVFEYPSGSIVGTAFDKKHRIGSVVFDPGGRYLIGGNSDGSLILWDVQRKMPVHSTPPGHSRAIIDVEISGDGRLAATLGQDQVIRMWSFDSTHPLAIKRTVYGQSAKAVAFSGDGKHIAAGDETGHVQVWELNSDKVPIVLQGHAQQVWALAFAPNRPTLASGDRSGQIQLWNLTNAALQRTIEAHGGSIWSLVFSPDGRQLLSTSDGQVQIWEVASGSLLATLKHEGGNNTRASLSPDGTLLAVTATDGQLRIWDLQNNRILKNLKADDDLLWSTAFSPDARQIAVASSDEVVTLWDLATGNQLEAFTGHTAGATDVAYLSDGVTVAVTDRSGRLHWWDAQTGRKLSEAWPAHSGTSWRLAVHPDGERIATAGDDGNVLVWDEFSVSRACEIGRRAFDEVRHRQFLGPNQRSIACD